MKVNLKKFTLFSKRSVKKEFQWIIKNRSKIDILPDQCLAILSGRPGKSKTQRVTSDYAEHEHMDPVRHINLGWRRLAGKFFAHNLRLPGHVRYRMPTCKQMRYNER